MIRTPFDTIVVFATIPYETNDDYLTWYYTVSHPQLIAPPRDLVREVSIPVYDEGLPDQWLSYISHELYRYLQRYQEKKDDNEFAKIFRALHVAQSGPLPRGGPVTCDNEYE